MILHLMQSLMKHEYHEKDHMDKSMKTVLAVKNLSRYLRINSIQDDPEKQ